MGESSASSVEPILRAANIRFAYLFGSRAAGQATAVSDADIAVMPAEGLSLLERSEHNQVKCVVARRRLLFF